MLFLQKVAVGTAKFSLKVSLDFHLQHHIKPRSRRFSGLKCCYAGRDAASLAAGRDRNVRALRRLLAPEDTLLQLKPATENDE